MAKKKQPKHKLDDTMVIAVMVVSAICILILFSNYFTVTGKAYASVVPNNVGVISLTNKATINSLQGKITEANPILVQGKTKGNIICGMEKSTCLFAYEGAMLKRCSDKIQGKVSAVCTDISRVIAEVPDVKVSSKEEGSEGNNFAIDDNVCFDSDRLTPPNPYVNPGFASYEEKKLNDICNLNSEIELKEAKCFKMHAGYSLIYKDHTCENCCLHNSQQQGYCGTENECAQECDSWETTCDDGHPIKNSEKEILIVGYQNCGKTYNNDQDGNCVPDCYKSLEGIASPQKPVINVCQSGKESQCQEIQNNFNNDCGID